MPGCQAHHQPLFLTRKILRQRAGERSPNPADERRSGEERLARSSLGKARDAWSRLRLERLQIGVELCEVEPFYVAFFFQCFVRYIRPCLIAILLEECLGHL